MSSFQPWPDPATSLPADTSRADEVAAPVAVEDRVLHDPVRRRGHHRRGAGGDPDVRRARSGRVEEDQVAGLDLRTRDRGPGAVLIEARPRNRDAGLAHGPDDE